MGATYTGGPRPSSQKCDSDLLLHLRGRCHHCDHISGDGQLGVVHQVDVTHASYGPWKKAVVHTSPPTTGANPNTLGNSSEQGGVGRDHPVCSWGLGRLTDGRFLTQLECIHERMVSIATDGFE